MNEDQPRLTYRERRERRAQRLEEWAAKRVVRGSASLDAANRIADGIPFGQPILVGHHSERRHRRDVDRIHNGMRAGFDHLAKAEEMRSKAANIEAAAEHAIYSDDPDAIERLRERIAGLVAERDMIAAYNASARKAAKTGGTGDLSILTPAWIEHLASIAKYTAYNIRPGNGFPPYATSNLSGQISAKRARLAQLERRQRVTVPDPPGPHEGHGCPDDPTWDPDRKAFG